MKPIKKRLGDILVDVGIITPEQLQNALEIQKRGGGKLGEILSQMGAINEEVMLAFIGKQCGASFVSLNEFGDIAQDIIKTIPESVARRQNLIPIAKDNNVLTVAMADPFNIFALDDIKIMTGYDVQVVIASEPDIKAAITKYFFSPAVFDTSSKQTQTSDEQINSLVAHALAMRANEIHFEPKSDSIRVRFRIDGTLHEQAPVSPEMKTAISKRLKLLAGLDPAQAHLPSQGHIKITIEKKDTHLKISILPTILGERLMLRILNPDLPSVDLSKLGFEPETLALYRKNIESQNGIIILTGPNGSGKTTTLYSTLNYLNYPDRNIITIEDVVEYLIPGLTQIQVNQERLFGYPKALEHAIDHKPDIIMVGELKGHSTTDLALNAALAGHLMFSVLHTSRSSGAVTHLFNMGIEPYKIASALKMIVTQRLIRMICQECKISYKLNKHILASAGIEFVQSEKNSNEITLYRGAGCPHCNNTGYAGQTAVLEVVEMDDKLRELVIERASENMIEEYLRKKNILSIRDAAWRKVTAGVSTIEEMMRITKNSDTGVRGALKC